VKDGWTWVRRDKIQRRGGSVSGSGLAGELHSFCQAPGPDGNRRGRKQPCDLAQYSGHALFFG